MKAIYEHLHGRVQKDFKAAVTYATSNFEKACVHAYDFLINPTEKTFDAFKGDQAFWENFVSDWVADIELKIAVIQSMNEGDSTLLENHQSYLKKLAENPNAVPKNTAQPKKKEQGVSVVEAPVYLH